MSLQKVGVRGRLTISVMAVLVLTFIFLVVPVVASRLQASLAGSNFEIDDDANLIADGAAPAIDWVNVDAMRRTDQPTGQSDDSFGQGAKEDTTAPAVVSGSIPPNKSDLKTFDIYVEENVNGKFLNLSWTRVQDPSGTTNMDFEFNQSTTISANGVTPERTAGDLLITYDLSKGGTVPILSLRTWDGAVWGPAVDLSASNAATGSINSTTIPDTQSDGLGTLDPRTFGEASIDLDFVFDSTKCISFGSAYLKSRSSDSFTSALKDFIAPQPVNITNCGKVIIRKETDPDGQLGSFGFQTTVTTDPAGGGSSFSLADGGVKIITNVLFGNGYTVTEDDPASLGFNLSNINCGASIGVTPSIDVLNRRVTFDIDDTNDVVDCTFTNQARGTIIIEKITPDGTGTFSFTSTTLTPAAFDLTTTADGDAGKVAKSFPDLLPGTYDIAESEPAGWNRDSATCNDGSSPSAIDLQAGETVTCTFTNVRERGAILVTKQRKHAAAGLGQLHPQPGVTFTVNGITGVTDEQGKICFDHLLYGEYSVTETLPAGYQADGDLTKTVTVSVESTCGDGSEAAVNFSNTPLTNIAVSVDSQVDGGTFSTIECVKSSDGASVGASGNFAPGTDDVNLAMNNLAPGTYVCTITIDP